jgi:hypothetical protein
MTTQEYKQMLINMRKELETLLEQQEEIEQKIAILKQAIMSFAPLAKEPETSIWSVFGETLGMTENIREILQAAYPKNLSPVEIKEQLKSRGQDLSQHKNVMASIHSTLKRMLENKEITTSDEGLSYGWRRKYVRRHHSRPNPFASGGLGTAFGTAVADEKKKE